MANPVVEFRASTTPFGTLSTINLTGNGASGAVIIGQSSNVATVRLYNNFAGAGSITDAFNVVLAAYDSDTAQGAATTTPVTQLWLNVSVQDYDGTATSGDAGVFYPIGGLTKHALPVNGGHLGGAAAHYATLNIKVVVPLTANQSSALQGLFAEYSYV